MRVEFELCSSDKDVALRIIPETDFESTFIKKAFSEKNYMTVGKEIHLIYMSGERLVESPNGK